MKPSLRFDVYELQSPMKKEKENMFNYEKFILMLVCLRSNAVPRSRLSAAKQTRR